MKSILNLIRCFYLSTKLKAYKQLKTVTQSDATLFSENALFNYQSCNGSLNKTLKPLQIHTL